MSAPRLRRFVVTGAAAGAAVGALFALAVIALADCAGPGCPGERALGLLVHAGLGAALGTVLGLAAFGISRIRR